MKSSAPLLLVCLFTAECLAQAPNWTLIKPTQSPVEMSRPAMSYDSSRKVTVLFGGRDTQTRSNNDTWEYDGTTWTKITPPLSPSARSGHEMVYDSNRNLSVMYGGPGMRDTWTWDGVTWTKIRIPAAQKPSARTSFAMAYDESRQKIVLFGGYDSLKGLVNDTWEFDGVIWAKVTSLVSTPPGRVDHAMAYDAHRKVVVLFGGDGQSGALNDTWEWNGTIWRQVTPAGNTPSARRATKLLAYDGNRRRVLMFGGNDGVLVDETWEYDGTSWTEVATATKPRGREQHRMVYDSDRRRVVMFGGTQNGRETWEYWGSPGIMTPDVDTVSLVTGGTQTLSLEAGSAHANLPYWIFGSITGATPGVALNGVHIPLNIDVYTQIAMQNVTANPPFNGFRSMLDANGEATAQFIVPSGLVNVGFKLHHAFIVFDGSGAFYCASNPVSIEIK